MILTSSGSVQKRMAMMILLGEVVCVEKLRTLLMEENYEMLAVSHRRGAVGPHGISPPPLAGSLEGSRPAVDDDPARELVAGIPLLNLDRLSSAPVRGLRQLEHAWE